MSDERSLPDGRSARGVANAPASKSHGIRALICAALAPGAGGSSLVLPAGPLPDDLECTVVALNRLGADVVRQGDGELSVRAGISSKTGATGESARGHVFINVGGSATAMRFLAAVAATVAPSLPGSVTIGGSPQLLCRPAGAIVAALRSMRVSVKGACGGSGGPRPPLEIAASDVPRGGEVVVDASESSHVVSALLLIGPTLADGLVVRAAGHVASRPYIELTCDVMRAFGASVVAESARGRPPAWRVSPGGYRPSDGRAHVIEADWSGASYLLAAAAATGGDVTVRNANPRSRQADRVVVDVLRAFGGVIGADGPHDGVRCSGRITRGIDIDLRDAPDLAPLVGALGCLASGQTTVTGAAHLRIKETDRIASVVRCARAFGCAAEEREDGFVVTGGGARGAVIDPQGDHRLAMAFAVAGLAIPGTRIADSTCVTKSFPTFWQTLESLTGPIGTDLRP